jgi:hypothetical protein
MRRNVGVVIAGKNGNTVPLYQSSILADAVFKGSFG